MPRYSPSTMLSKEAAEGRRLEIYESFMRNLDKNLVHMYEEEHGQVAQTQNKVFPTPAI